MNKCVRNKEDRILGLENEIPHPQLSELNYSSHLVFIDSTDNLRFVTHG
jgi:hypothetical protein